MAEILSGYGHSLAQAGRGDEAQQSFNDSLALARDLKNESLVSQLLRFQGDAAAYRGDFKGARALYDQALQSATAAKDSENILLARLALAHNDVQQAHWSAAISSLKPLIQQSETQGLKYEALQGSLDLGEALINTKALPQARQELERAQTRSEKLGTLSLQARAEYLLATVYRLSGNNSLAIDHYREALRLLNDIRKEAENDKILQRADFAAIITDAKRYTS
jgi:tetratricopeptide (TPR) repeat protein